jgi:hypothetical protein
MDIKEMEELSEVDICDVFITPAIEEAVRLVVLATKYSV